MEVEIDGPDKKVCIGTTLNNDQKQAMTALLKEFKEGFAWKPSDMPGISTDNISHELRIDPSIKPIAQKRRLFGSDKRLAIRQEVGKLIEADFVREVRFQSWVANPVLVKKSNGKWRMCVDFRDLNRACPKDSYPLPRIDQLVDTTSGHEIRPYFHAHDITFLTNQPLKNFMLKPDSSGRMVKWAIELTELKIKFAPKTAIKGQALTDFIVESTSNGLTEADSRPSSSADTSQIWELYTDGCSSREGSGAGLILIPLEGEPLKYAIALTFQATNNEVECEALITGLRLAKGMGISAIRVKSNSELIVNQVNDTYEEMGKR